MDLDAEAGVEIVGQHPFGERARVEQAIFGGARDGGSLAKGWGEDEVRGIRFKSVSADEVSGVLVVFTRGEDEFEFVARGEGGEVLRTEAQMLAAGGAFDVHDFVDLAGDEFERSLAAGFEEQLVG